MADLTDPEPPQEDETLNKHLESVLQQVIQEKLYPIIHHLNDTERQLSQMTKQNEELRVKNDSFKQNLMIVKLTTPESINNLTSIVELSNSLKNALCQLESLQKKSLQ